MLPGITGDYLVRKSTYGSLYVLTANISSLDNTTAGPSPRGPWLNTSTMGQPILELISGRFNNRIFYNAINKRSRKISFQAIWMQKAAGFIHRECIKRILLH